MSQELHTIQDFVDTVTQENLERLVADFAHFLNYVAAVKALAEAQGLTPWKSEYMTVIRWEWTDDGKTELSLATITLQDNDGRPVSVSKLAALKPSPYKLKK